MKVNISYAVELEDIPSEVGKLIGSCEHALRALHADIDMLSAADPISTISEISKMRENLMALDLRLSDCSRILAGFLEVQSKVSLGQLGDNPEEEPGG